MVTVGVISGSSATSRNLSWRIAEQAIDNTSLSLSGKLFQRAGEVLPIKSKVWNTKTGI
jgi:hypothetical protein